MQFMQVVVVLWLLGSAACDVIITATLTWYLVRTMLRCTIQTLLDGNAFFSEKA